MKIWTPNPACFRLGYSEIKKRPPDGLNDGEDGTGTCEKGLFPSYETITRVMDDNNMIPLIGGYEILKSPEQALMNEFTDILPKKFSYGAYFSYGSGKLNDGIN